MKKEKKNWFSKHGITVRIVVLFIVLVILPFFIMFGVVLHIFQKYNYTNLGNTVMDAMSSVGFQISEELKNRRDSSMFVYYNDIEELLDTQELSDIDREAIEKRIQSSVYSTDGISAGVVIDREGNVFSVGSYGSTLTYMESRTEEIQKAGGRCCWYVVNRGNGNADSNKYILARAIYNEDRKYVGLLYLIMGDSVVTNAFKQLKSDLFTRYLTDADGTILYSSESHMLFKNLDISSLDTKKTAGYQLVTMSDGRKVIMASRKIWTTGWYCVGVIETSDITRRAMELMRPFLFITVIYAGFLLTMLNMLRKYIFRPLGTLKKAMDQYAQGELQVLQIDPVGVGELRSLSDHFNEMMIRIDNLITGYRAEVEEKNRQKLLVLSAQLTPHFIYNALNTIKWMAVLNHQENIQKQTESLIYVLMNAAGGKDDAYCVGDELKLIENYAVIQKARFMNFELTIECEERCRDLRIRKFLLQPIVENAVIHGLKRGKIKNTEIRVTVWSDENLHILVEDEGVGFDVKQWKDNPRPKEGHSNIGIKNVEEMIRIEYGEAYGMRIESTPGKGTRVFYLLPEIRRNKDDSDNYCG